MKLSQNIIVVIYISVFFIYSKIQCQDSSNFKIVENIPRYNNGEYHEFRNEIERLLKFPEYAIRNNIYGRVFVRFTVDGQQPNGKRLNNVYVVKGVHPSLDYVAKQIVEEAPDLWDCRLPRGKMEAVTFTFPIDFRKQRYDTSSVTLKYNNSIEKIMLLDSLKLDSLLYKSWPLPSVVEEVKGSITITNSTELSPCNGSFKVSGKVVDENNLPITGVTILITGTATGTITNADGLFEFKVPCDSEIIFSFIGYNSRKMMINKNMIDKEIQLTPAYKEFP